MNAIVQNELHKMNLEDLKDVKEEVDRLLFLYKDMKFKHGKYYCEFCSNITFHDKEGRCENTLGFGG